MPQHACRLYSAPTMRMRGNYVAVYIYQFPLFIPDKNKHVVSDQMFNYPHSKYLTMAERLHTRTLSIVCSVLRALAMLKKSTWKWKARIF